MPRPVIIDVRRLHPLTVQPPGVVLLRPDGRPASHRPEQSRVCTHEVDVDASVQVPVWSAQVTAFEFAGNKSSNL